MTWNWLPLWSLLITAGLASATHAGGVGRTDIGQPPHRMIWTQEQSPDEKRAHYVAFRRTFTLIDQPSRAVLDVFADSRCVLWVNGQYVARGPARFDPAGPEFDRHEVAHLLQRGRNAIAVLVLAGASNGKTMRHAPGLSVQLQAVTADSSTSIVETDLEWRWSADTCYRPPAVKWGFICDDIDGRRGALEWVHPSFDDANWGAVREVDVGQWGKLTHRHVPLLSETELSPLPMNSEPLPRTLTERQELVLDIGRMAQGYEVVEVDAELDTELTVEHAQRFVDGQVRESYGAITRYVARAGVQQFMPIDSYGCRYLKVRVEKGRAELRKVRFIERQYPFEHVGRFECSDPFLNDLWKRSVHTLQQTSDDAFMDCGLRERAEWIGDAVVVQYPVSRVAFAGPERPFKSDPRLIESAIRRVALSRQPDGRVKAHHPSDRWDIHGYIEDYSCLWVQSLREVYERTNDTTLVEEVWPAVTAQLDLLLSTRTGRGLIHGREFVIFDNPLKYKVCEGATLNAMVYRALLDAAVLADAIKDKAVAARYQAAAVALRAAFNEHLWDAASGTYAGGIVDGQRHVPTAHAALLALNRGVVPDDRVKPVRAWLMDHFDKRDGIRFPYTYFWLFEELYRTDTDDADRLVLSEMRTRWANMMSRTDTGTLIESFGGGEACHNFGAVPAYFLSSYVLGVTSNGPAGSREISVEPRLGDLSFARGAVVTELGVVEIGWEIERSRLSIDLRLPVDVKHVTLRVPAELTADLRINGLPATGSTNGRWHEFRLNGSQFRVEASMRAALEGR